MELPGKSREAIRQEMKKLTDEGKVVRLYNGVYYLSYKTILGTKGRVSVDKFIKKKYLEANGKTTGYITGIQLANMYGFTTQNPSCYEVCSNEASTKQRKLDVDGRQIIVYKPVVDISEENKGALQFLDLMSTIDKYSEVNGDELIEKMGVEFEERDGVLYPLVNCGVSDNIKDVRILGSMDIYGLTLCKRHIQKDIEAW